MDLNRCTLTGRLTEDPDFRYTKSGTAICRFGVAVNRYIPGNEQAQGKEETLFIPVTTWGKTAETIHAFLRKGSRVALDGYLQLHCWQTQEGENRKEIRLIARDVVFLSKKEKSDAEGTRTQPSSEPEPEREEVPF